MNFYSFFFKCTLLTIYFAKNSINATIDKREKISKFLISSKVVNLTSEVNIHALKCEEIKSCKPGVILPIWEPQVKHVFTYINFYRKFFKNKIFIIWSKGLKINFNKA